MKRFFIVSLFYLTVHASAQTLPNKLSGILMHSSEQWTLDSQYAFDNDISTSCASSKESNAWVGLDLGTKHVITSIRWHAISDDPVSTTLSVFEGANREDFMDAIPIFLNGESGDGESMIDVTCGFRYVRYCGPTNSYCKISEVEFYGYESEGTDLHFYQPTNLPAVIIHVENAKEPEDKINDLLAYCTVIYGKETKRLSENCTFRLRGNFSRWALPKKPYRIKFENKQKMPDAPGKAKKWTLIPSYGDKTLMRNILAFDMSRRVGMPYTPYCRPVDVFVNGEYKGCYQLCDQLTVSKDRVNITELTADDITEPNITGGYFFEIDGNSSSEDLRLYSNVIRQFLTIKSPDNDVMQQAQKNYLLTQFNQMMARTDNTFTGFNPILDKDAFAKFFIISEFIANTDTYWETYMYKDRNDEKFYMGPIWDCDLGYDNDNRTHNYLNNSNSTGWTYQHGGTCGGDMYHFSNSVLADNEYMQRIKEIWAYTRASNVNEETLLSVVDKKEELLMASQKLNFQRWPILNTITHNNYQALGSYEKEVGTIREYIPRRLAWFDKTLLTDIGEHNIHISDSKWATVYTPFAFSAPAGARMYSIQKVDASGRLVLERVNVAEPNKPYLLNGVEGDYTVTAYRVPEIEGNNNGLLVGTNMGILASQGSYVLKTIEGKTGFYQVDDPSIVVDANQAFLSIANVDLTSTTSVFYLDDAIINALDLNEDGNYSIVDMVLLLDRGDAEEIDIHTLTQKILNDR